MTPKALSGIAEYIKNRISHARIIVDGVETTKPINDFLLSGTKLDVTVVLDSTLAGTISEVALIDVDGDAFDVRSETITKSNRRGSLYIFRYNVMEVAK